MSLEGGQNGDMFYQTVNCLMKNKQNWLLKVDQNCGMKSEALVGFQFSFFTSIH